jgi:hypothetical protein
VNRGPGQARAGTGPGGDYGPHRLQPGNDRGLQWISLRGGPRAPMLVVMSRGPTRRVHRLLGSGAVSGQLLQAADHEADLLGHPYIGLEHLDLGRLDLAGLTTERDALRQRMRGGVRRRWWRPRGPNSALRRRGRKQTEGARLSAEREQHGDGAVGAR